jgi:hypothetical protein
MNSEEVMDEERGERKGADRKGASQGPGGVRKSVDFGRGCAAGSSRDRSSQGRPARARLYPVRTDGRGTILFKICGPAPSAFFPSSFQEYGRERRRRLQLFARGRYTEGKVAAYGRAFSPWKSARDYTLTVEITLSDGTVKRNTIRSAKESLHADHPIGSAIPLLVDDVGGAVLYAGEIGADPEWC